MRPKLSFWLITLRLEHFVIKKSWKVVIKVSARRRCKHTSRKDGYQKAAAEGGEKILRVCGPIEAGRLSPATHLSCLRQPPPHSCPVWNWPPPAAKSYPPPPPAARLADVNAYAFTFFLILDDLDVYIARKM